MSSKKPIGQYEIDWSHPLAKGLVGCWTFKNGSLINLVTGKNPISTTGILEQSIYKGKECLYVNEGSFSVNIPFKNGNKLTILTSVAFDNTIEDHGILEVNSIDPVVWADTSSSQLRSAFYAGIAVYGSLGELNTDKFYSYGAKLEFNSTDSGSFIDKIKVSSGSPQSFALESTELVTIFTSSRRPKAHFEYVFLYDDSLQDKDVISLQENPYQIFKLVRTVQQQVYPALFSSAVGAEAVNDSYNVTSGVQLVVSAELGILQNDTYVCS